MEAVIIPLFALRLVQTRALSETIKCAIKTILQTAGEGQAL